MDPLIERQRKHFNAISDRYLHARAHPNHLFYKDLLWSHFFARNRSRLTGIHRVLEPMCGLTEGYSILSKHLGSEFSYLGFDYSESMVSLAREKNPRLSIEQRDVTTYHSADTLFDLIILVGGLHHVYEHILAVLTNLRASLRPGGYFLSFEPTQDNWLARRVRRRIYQSNPLFDPVTERGFEYRDFQRYFGDAGYEKVDEVYPGLLAYVLYYNPDAFPALNVGGRLSVSGSFALDRLLWANSAGRKLSLATISLWKRN